MLRAQGWVGAAERSKCATGLPPKKKNEKTDNAKTHNFSLAAMHTL
jgi:hypothetical protein